jgi:hypothetical protein
MSILIDEITQVSLERYEIIDAYEGNRKISIGRAMTGGALFGQTGAILGGLSGETGDRKYKVLIVMKDGRQDIITCTEDELKVVINRASGKYHLNYGLRRPTKLKGEKWILLLVVIGVPLLIWLVWHVVSSSISSIKLDNKYSKLNEEQREGVKFCQSIGYSRSDCIEMEIRFPNR